MAIAKTNDESLQSARSTVRRKRDRARYDRAAVDALLDEAYVCHVGFNVNSTPIVQPMAYARVGTSLYLHGAAGNRMLRELASGIEVCVTVTLIDALVLARSAFHHSMNYRSAILFGTAERVTDPAELRLASDALVEHLVAGRSAEVRPPSSDELRQTLVLRVAIREGSLKQRSGGPVDEPEDLNLRVWAGELPLSLAPGEPVADENLDPTIAAPQSTLER